MSTTTQQQPAPDFGEPWQSGVNHDSERTRTWIQRRGEYCDIFNGGSEYNPYLSQKEQENAAKRAVSCVNACQGMADPAKEIQVIREAIKEAHEAFLTWNDVGRCKAWEDAKEAALAKLQPLLP